MLLSCSPDPFPFGTSAPPSSPHELRNKASLQLALTVGRIPSVRDRRGGRCGPVPRATAPHSSACQGPPRRDRQCIGRGSPHPTSALPRPFLASRPNTHSPRPHRRGGR